MTSVAIPAFDYKYNEENNDALLLGVAGTDVPIDSIAKLAKPHQVIAIIVIIVTCDTCVFTIMLFSTFSDENFLNALFIY